MDVGLTHAPPPDYDDVMRRRRLAYLEFTDRDVQLLQDIAQLIEGRIDAIVDKFYEHLLADEETRSIFQDADVIQRLKSVQRAYLRQSLRGPFDKAYFQARWQIGYIHNAIKLAPHWFLGGFQLYHRIIGPMIADAYAHDTHAAVEHVLALDKIMNLDAQLGIDSYMAHYVATMDQLRLLNLQIQQATAAKSLFLANMSHEFRTPLNAIIGFTEVMNDFISGPMTKEQREYLDEIHRAGRVLLRLVNDVLDLSKVEAGRLDLFYQTFPVGQVIRESVAAIRGEAEKRGLLIDIKLPLESVLINADPIRFKQILYNLLTNAVKFTHKGWIRVAVDMDGDFLHLRVQDTGVGIRVEDQARIFEAFSQVDASDARQYEGTGLGLTVSRQLAEAHGGRLWVESELGKGSTFHVLIPLKPPMAKREQAS